MSGINDILTRLESENRLRVIPGSLAEGVTDLSSNDYLSLATRQAEFMPEFLDRFSDAPFTSSASRLLSGRQKYHLMLEQYLSTLYGGEALLFNSGYHANVGCIGALTLRSTLFLCDKLIHASVIDGLRIVKSEVKRFPHNDMRGLERLLEQNSGKFDHIVVVVESIYSMDGDCAPLRKIVELKRRFPGVMIYLDEAHAFGVRGERGLGLAEEEGLIKEIDILIGTFGKAAASAGAFAITSGELKSLLINTARPFIFSTALPPVNVAWSLLMTEKIVEMREQRSHLSRLAQEFRRLLEETTGTGSPSESQIIPYLTGDAARALEIAARLREGGYIALPIRRPTVPPGGERIRFSLAAGMSIDALLPLFDLL